MTKKDKVVRCAYCVMDTTDIAIVFDSNGICDHCNSFLNKFQALWFKARKGLLISELREITETIKLEGKSNKYNCIIGLSGGTDSSYVLHYIVTELGLRPLVFHIDTGWNTKAAVANINNLVTKLGLQLQVKVIDWEEMRALQLAFFQSGVSNIDVPQDHAFMAYLYNFAYNNNIKYIFNGGNISTEGVRVPLAWMYYQSDVSLLKDIAKKYMDIPLKKFPLSSVLNHKFYLRWIKGIKVIKPLDYIPYVKSEAVELLQSLYDWEPFRYKHYESIFTRFYEGYWLPKRFNFDTRKITLSSMIHTSQITREESIETLSKPALTKLESMNECSFIAKKLRISLEELQQLESLPIKTYKDYKNQSFIYNLGARSFFWDHYSGAKR